MPVALIFDTETTGLPLHPKAKDSLQPRIIEFGAALVNFENGDVLATESILINPGVPLPEVITKITGLTDDMLRDEPLFRDVAPRLEPMFAKADVIIAHNLPFDKRMMRLELARIGRLDDWPWPAVELCTVAEHMDTFGRRMKLKELYKYYNEKPLAQTHRALDDVMALASICRECGIFNGDLL